MIEEEQKPDEQPVEPTPEQRAQMEEVAKNLSVRFHTVNGELYKLQGQLVGRDKLGVQAVVNLQKRYTDLQQTLYFINSMYDAIFPKNTPPPLGEAKILTPESIQPDSKPQMSVV